MSDSESGPDTLIPKPPSQTGKARLRMLADRIPLAKEHRLIDAARISILVLFSFKKSDLSVYYDITYQKLNRKKSKQEEIPINYNIISNLHIIQKTKLFYKQIRSNSLLSIHNCILHCLYIYMHIYTCTQMSFYAYSYIYVYISTQIVTYLTTHLSIYPHHFYYYYHYFLTFH